MTIAWLFVTLSGMLHAVWNLLAKRSTHPLVFLWSLQWVAVIAFLPWAWVAMADRPISVRGWVLLGLTVTVHGIYVMLLARTYATGDLSQVYPLMRGVSPLLVPILGMTLLGERISGVGGIGIVGVVIGIGLLGDWRWRREPELTPLVPNATGIALAVGLAITSYTVLDKVALHYIPPVTLSDSGNFGNLLALSWGASRSGAIRAEWTRHWQAIMVGGICRPAGICSFCWDCGWLPLLNWRPLGKLGRCSASHWVF